MNNEQIKQLVGPANYNTAMAKAPHPDKVLFYVNPTTNEHGLIYFELGNTYTYDAIDGEWFEADMDAF